LWDYWQRGELVIESCTIVTTDANELLRPLHDRMPVILDPADYATWLDPRCQEPEQLESLLTTYPTDRMTMSAVSTVVNSARSDTPQCLAPAAAVKTQGVLFD
jgi:putative SOS response-associated peptidase YedK